MVDSVLENVILMTMYLAPESDGDDDNGADIFLQRLTDHVLRIGMEATCMYKGGELGLKGVGSLQQNQSQLHWLPPPSAKLQISACGLL